MDENLKRIAEVVGRAIAERWFGGDAKTRAAGRSRDDPAADEANVGSCDNKEPSKVSGDPQPARLIPEKNASR